MYSWLSRCSTASARGSSSWLYLGGPTMMKVILVNYEKDGTLSMYDQGEVVVPGEVVRNNYLNSQMFLFTVRFEEDFSLCHFHFPPCSSVSTIYVTISHTQESLSLSLSLSNV